MNWLHPLIVIVVSLFLGAGITALGGGLPLSSLAKEQMTTIERARQIFVGKTILFGMFIAPFVWWVVTNLCR